MREMTSREKSIFTGKKWKEKAILLETHFAYKYMGKHEQCYLTPEQEVGLRRDLKLFGHSVSTKLQYAHIVFLPYSVNMSLASERIDHRVSKIVASYESLRLQTALYLTQELTEPYIKGNKTKYMAEQKALLKAHDIHYDSAEKTLSDKTVDILGSMLEQREELITELKYTKDLIAFNENYFKKHLPLKPYIEGAKDLKADALFAYEYVFYVLLKDLKKLLGDTLPQNFYEYPSWAEIPAQVFTEDHADGLAYSYFGKMVATYG
jgi:hypothetical protein